MKAEQNHANTNPRRIVLRQISDADDPRPPLNLPGAEVIEVRGPITAERLRRVYDQMPPDKQKLCIEQGREYIAEGMAEIFAAAVISLEATYDIENKCGLLPVA